MTAEIAFYFFSFLIISSSLGVVLVKNPVYSVLLMIFAFFNASAILVLLNAQFIAMTLVIVYVGAVAVLFLFVVMLINIKQTNRYKILSKYFVIISATFIVLLLEFYFIITTGIENFINPVQKGDNIVSIRALGIELFDVYFYPFFVVSLILTVAMIGTVVLSSDNKNVFSLSQSISSQNSRKSSTSVKNVTMENEEGIS